MGNLTTSSLFHFSSFDTDCVAITVGIIVQTCANKFNRNNVNVLRTVQNLQHRYWFINTGAHTQT